MSDIVLKAATELIGARETRGGYVVGTTNLLPSGDLVKLFITLGKTSCLVTDRGMAVTQLEDMGAKATDAAKALKVYARKFGVSANTSEIFHSSSLSDIPASIVLVANAVSDVVKEEARRLKFSSRRDIKEALSQYLRRRVGEIADTKRTLRGLYAEHEFAHVFESTTDKRIIIVDPVLSEPSSINSRVVAHFDVRAELGTGVEGLMVYDDEEDWTVEKLGLLRLAGDAVPFRHIDKALSSRLPLH